MKRGTRVFAALVALSFSLSFITACSSSSDPHPDGDPTEAASSEAYAACLAPYTGAANHLSAEEQRLYNDTVIALLEQELWTSRDAYDASHYLMVPMFYAFRSGESSLIEAYARFLPASRKKLETEPLHLPASGIWTSCNFIFLRPSSWFSVLCMVVRSWFRLSCRSCPNGVRSMCCMMYRPTGALNPLTSIISRPFYQENNIAVSITV